MPELGLPAAPRVRFVFPHAPVQPVTINGGFRMRAWYDIYNRRPAGCRRRPRLPARSRGPHRAREGTGRRAASDHPRGLLAGRGHRAAHRPALSGAAGRHPRALDLSPARRHPRRRGPPGQPRRADPDGTWHAGSTDPAGTRGCLARRAASASVTRSSGTNTRCRTPSARKRSGTSAPGSPASSPPLRGPADRPQLPAPASAAEEPIAAIGLESRHAHSGRHLEPLQHVSRSRIDPAQFALVTFPGAVPELSVDPGHPGDEAIGLDRAKNRPGLRIDSDGSSGPDTAPPRASLRPT